MSAAWARADVDQAHELELRRPRPRAAPTGAYLRVWLPSSILTELDALARCGGCTVLEVAAWVLAEGTCEPRRARRR